MPALRAHHIAVLLAATLGAGAHAQSAVSREQVKAELAQAIRSGNMIGDGNTGQTLRELNPQRYPAAARSERRYRYRNAGTPTNASSTPMGISVGAATVRHSASAHTVSAAPMNADAGNA